MINCKIQCEGSSFQGTKGHLFPGSCPSRASKVTFFRVSKQPPLHVCALHCVSPLFVNSRRRLSNLVRMYGRDKHHKSGRGEGGGKPPIPPGVLRTICI